jgi:hypothetical protein
MSRARRLLAGLTLACLGVALALVMIEAGVRALHLVPTRFWEPDPELGTRLIPGRRGWWTQEEHEFRVPVRINEHGLRDLERDYEKPQGTWRVLVLGDSFIEALHVPLDEMFGRRLEAQLNERDSSSKLRFEVISAGVSSWGTASQLLFYRTQGRRYDPDLVVLAFYPGNDVMNNSPTLEPVLRAVYDERGELVRVAPVSSLRRDTDERGWLGRSQAYQYLRKQLLTRHPSLARTLARIGLIDPAAIRQQHESKGVPLDYWVYATDAGDAWRDAWRYTERLLGELQREAAADGAALTIIIITAREALYPDTWSQILAAHPAMREVRWNLEGPERRLIRWCEQSGVPCLRLSQVFARERRNELLHYPHDGHWTAAGHALAANSVARFLEEASVLPPEAR